MTNITSDECEGPARNMTCSTEFQILGHPDASYAVSIKSSYAWFYCVHTADFVDVVGGSIKDSLSHSIFVTPCELHFACSPSPALQAEGCAVRARAAEDTSPESSLPSVHIPLNEVVVVRYNAKSTTCRYVISVNTYNITIQVVGFIDTKTAVSHFTPSSLGLLASGLVTWFITASLLLAMAVLSWKLHSKASQQVRKVVVICVFTVGASFVILSGLVWGGSGVQIGLQDDTCSLKWISARDHLMVSALILTAIVFLYVLVATMTLGCAVNKDNLMDLWSKITPRDRRDVPFEEPSMNYDQFYMKQNQVYRQEMFEGNDEVDSNAHHYYLTQNHEHPDSQGYSEIGGHGTKNGPSTQYSNSIRIDDTQIVEPKVPCLESQRDVRDGGHSSESAIHHQQQGQWLYKTIPEHELDAVYDLPHQRGQRQQGTPCQSGKPMSECSGESQQDAAQEWETPHNYDVIPDKELTAESSTKTKKKTSTSGGAPSASKVSNKSGVSDESNSSPQRDGLVASDREGGPEPAVEVSMLQEDSMEYRYSNQTGLHHSTRPYVNQKLDKREWPYGFVV